MPYELANKLEELFSYYDLDSGDWPLDSVYSGGSFVRGVISDELYQILTDILEIVEEHRL